MISHPELLTCPHGGDLLVLCPYLAWEKTVQRLDRVVSVASRPGRCPHTTCTGSRLRLLSAAGQRIALAGAPYGSDVLVRMGWRRQEHHATESAMHTALAAQVRISASHVRSLSPQGSLPLLAGPERPHQAPLAQLAKQHGGLSIALDGLAPHGGEPQIGCIRALARGLPLRRGWLCQPDQPPCEAFLAPLQPREWPILAVLSDKPTGVVPAVATVWPRRRHPWCQAHYRRHLAEPLAAAEAACKGAVRQPVRQQVGDVIRQAPRTAPGQAGVLTVTGLVPRPLAAPETPASQGRTPTPSPTALQPEAPEVLLPLLHPTHSLRTLTGRPPLRLAGMETYERLQPGARGRLALLAKGDEPRLAQWSQGLTAAFFPCAPPSQAWQQGAAWLHDIAHI